MGKTQRLNWVWIMTAVTLVSETAFHPVTVVIIDFP